MSIKFKVSGVDRMVRTIAKKGKQARTATNRELDLSSKRISLIQKRQLILEHLKTQSFQQKQAI